MIEHPVEYHGLVEISNDDYHAGPGISKSHLDVAAESMFKYWDGYVNPNRERKEPTPAMILGTATHSAILEPDLFPSQFIAMPEGLTRQTKAGKEHYEELLATGKTVLKHDEFKHCLAMRDAVHLHPVAGPLFKNGRSEQAYYAIDNETGELIKCKPDFMNDNGFMVDLKKTTDASPDGFAKSVANYRYYVQAPWYLDILERLYSEAPPYFIFVAVEETRPYDIGVYFVDNAQLELGRRRYMKDLRRIAECKATGNFPGYSSQIEPLRLPKWLNTSD
jgi:hypothetical protein